MKSITFSRGNEQQAWMFGWGHNQQASVEGRYVGTCTRDGDRDPDFRFLFRSRDGDSGGGVWDRHGRLIGVVWGDDPYGSVVVSTSKVEAFLATNERCFRFFRRPQAVINVSYSQGVVATPPVFPSESPLAVLGESAPPPPEIQQTPPLPSKVIPPAATHLPSPQIPSKTAPAPQSNGVGLAQAFEIPVTLQVEIRARIGDAIRAAVQAR
jgi:hypothetical protein